MGQSRMEWEGGWVRWCLDTDMPRISPWVEAPGLVEAPGQGGEGVLPALPPCPVPGSLSLAPSLPPSAGGEEGRQTWFPDTVLDPEEES